ncbi:P-type phospholipid transporter [Malassezia cuniculi]|uniref:Phospholipid-transporting ATPase n=1 Tax=Malassezia cuniculi TaxID=948313 RepID=A0AAF0J6B2_9BASI|nr:P-type phospholipid transporter [Malassezia cuniculi]
MDDIEALFGRPAAPTRSTRVREEPVHVIGDPNDMDLLGDEPGGHDHSISRAADSWLGDGGLSRTGSLSSVRKESVVDDPLTSGWDDLEDSISLRPRGSAKTIEADDDIEGESWITQELRAAGTSGPRPKRARPQQPAQKRVRPPPREAGPTFASALLADARRQYRLLRRLGTRAIRTWRGQYTAQSTRTVWVNDAPKNAADLEFCDNQVTTNKYNVVTFVPLFLYEQFSKYANVFFLFIGCIQQIPNVSPTNRWTTLVPLAIVLLASAFKEVTEDWRRFSADAEMNARRVGVLEADGTFSRRKWRDVVVGDIVRVERNEFFPADLILLASSEPEGLAYVETANLDGETNLKVKQASQATAKMTTAASMAALHGKLECETPNNHLYTFEGTLELGSTRIPIGPEQMLLRGAQLRNAPWIFGLVVFTGHDTKLMRNTTATPIKRTRVDHQVNRFILMLFVLLLALAIISSIGWAIQSAHDTETAKYLMLDLDERSGVRQFVESVLTFIILYNSLIPISLIVTMEVVKFQQAALIGSDLDLYYEPTDTPALCRRSNLVEDLGQVDYVFSDKTGTLTRNEMEFRQASIAGVAFASEKGEASIEDEYDGNELVGGQRTWAELPGILDSGTRFGRAVDDFVTLLAVCHTVIPETIDGRVVFQASSPDEAALVAGAQSLGYTFTTRTPRAVNIDVRGKSQTFQVLQVCEFNSTRKRMSTIVRRPDGRIVLMTKGADTVILPRLAPKQSCVEQTLSHLEMYAADGLRTLCIAMREISEQEYSQWAAVYEKAAASLDGRTAALDAAAEEIEKDLVLLGATAIEDKLQDGVPDTIATLQEAGIRVWVLTGDRQETAINIGYSCRLISESMSVLTINESDAQATADALQRNLDTVRAQVGDITTPSDELALVIEGASLQHVLHSASADVFFELASICKAVVCCRVSPLQKALVVEMVKARADAILLAIGDGANDVGMIQAAHIGVGISGLEGLQAARSADVAISQFRFLKKLLLVHGNWSYARLSKMVLYSFYKTITLYLTLFWYSFYNRFSGQTAYESWSQSFYNVVFTVMPTLVIGVLDQYVSAVMLERYPQLYRQTFFSGKHIAEWMANSVYHSIVAFFFVTYVMYDGIQVSDGYDTYQWIWGTTLYFVVLVTVLGKAALVLNLWTRYTVLAIPGSFAVTIAFIVVYGTIAPSLGVSMEFYSIVPRLLTFPLFWLLIVCVPATCLLRDLLWKFWQRTYRPQAYHIVQEMQKYNIQDAYPRADQFQKNIRKVRAVQRLRRARGYAFSQTEGAQADLIRQYDTTKKRPSGM